MEIRLFWDNINTVDVEINIYRDTSPIDRENLPAPLVTLTGDQTSYVDQDVVRDTDYYYVFETVSATDRALSPNHKVVALPSSGPGPQRLVVGDYEFGYYGIVPSAEFINTNTLITALGFNAGVLANNVPNWHKFAYEGKTLFVPEQTLLHSVSWRQLYEAGLVYGVDGPGPNMYDSTPVNQLRTVQLKADTFIVRLMRGGPENAERLFTLPATLEYPSEATVGSEWDDLIYPLANIVPATQRTVNFANLAYNAIMSSVGQYHWCQEINSENASQALCRGRFDNSEAGISHYEMVEMTTANNTYGWRPVLELVPHQDVDLTT